MKLYLQAVLQPVPFIICRLQPQPVPISNNHVVAGMVIIETINFTPPLFPQGPETPLRQTVDWASAVTSEVKNLWKPPVSFRLYGTVQGV